ncbi:hypothetical protein [Streptomyces sp. NPDC048636]|uniref:hypothetical protein n=1 Tax=Streptomyces sp. NPDC048636 TaxID=3155762 RepID=UPI00343B6E77
MVASRPFRSELPLYLEESAMIDAPAFTSPSGTSELASVAPGLVVAGPLPAFQDDLVIEELTDASRGVVAPRACICICTAGD